MQIDISNGWKYTEGTESDENGIPREAVEVDLPVDLLRFKNRNYNTALGIYGSYYDPVAAAFFRKLPSLHGCSSVILEIEGVNQYADVYLGGVAVAHISGAGKHFIDISRYYVSGAKNILKLRVWAPQMAGRYTGAGISGGVRLHTYETGVVIPADGVYVTTAYDGGKAALTIHSEVLDTDGTYSTAKKRLALEAVIYNARGKRTARKVKKIKLKGTDVNHCSVVIRPSRVYMWTVDDPYMYTVKVAIKDENGKILAEGGSGFGIVSRSLSENRGLVLNGRSVKLEGAVVQPDLGILGMESTRAAEEYKLSRIKAIGYNAVRYEGVPTEAALDTLDKLGLMAEIDLFGVWAQGEFPYDGHVGFAENKLYDCRRFVRQLRKHPSVTVYGLDRDAAETYERGDGCAVAKELADAVRMQDDSRPLSVNARERMPLASELERAGIKIKSDDAITLGAGREKDLFGKLTENSFACADIAGYAYLYPRYASDRSEYPDRFIMGVAAYPSRAFEAFEECEKNPNVLGEFLYCGADYLGYPLGKPVYENEQARLLPPHTSYCGDLDIIYNRKPSAYYRSIMLGNRSESLITVSDPEAPQKTDSAGHSVKEAHSVWNWPHNLGRNIDIEVFSGGEVVALYRDGKLIGRKLAGKINKHIATFRTEYYPGKLEAVSYHKGRECSRVTLESVTAPRTVKLNCGRKSAAAGELIFVEICVNDKEGRLVPYASREVELSVEGSGELYALGSADPELRTRTGGENICQVYDGRALAVIKTKSGGDGKITVKAAGDGLTCGKINLRVKD